MRRRRLLPLAFAAALLLLYFRLFKSSSDDASSLTSGSPSASPSAKHADFIVGDVDLEYEEDVTRYSPGGYHPVTIGDAFKDGRYVVKRKIGYGEYSTVWLSEDVQCVELPPVLPVYLADTRI